MKVLLHYLVTFHLLLTFLGACKKANFEENYLKKNPSIDTAKVNQPPTCDTLDLSFAGKIKPIFDTHCNSCHSTAAGTYPALDKYQESKDNIQLIIDAIKQNGNASPMPKGASKLDDCTINKVVAWKNKGFPQ